MATDKRTTALQQPRLLEPILEHDLDEIKRLYRQDAQLLREIYEAGRTTLHTAVLQGNIAIITYLCEQRPDLLRATDNEGRTALYEAVLQGNIEIVQYVYAQRPESLQEIHENDYEDLLTQADALGNEESATFLRNQRNILLHQSDKSNSSRQKGNIFSTAYQTNNLFATRQPKMKRDILQKITEKKGIIINKVQQSIDDYLQWRNENASGSPWLRRWGNLHFYHGATGYKTANGLLNIVKSKTPSYIDVITGIKNAAEKSGNAEHSLSRYMYDALFGTKTVGNGDISQYAFKKMKSEGFSIPSLFLLPNDSEEPSPSKQVDHIK